MNALFKALSRMIAAGRPVAPVAHFEFGSGADGRRELVVDGRAVSPTFDAVIASTLQEWPGHFAFIAQRLGQDFVVLNGHVFGAYDRVCDQRLLRQGDHIAYAAESRGRVRVVKDGRPWRRAFDAVHRLALSPAGSLYASVVSSRAAGTVYTHIDATGTTTHWDGPYDLYCEGKRLGSASVPQEPVFWKTHALWISSLGHGYEPPRSQILDARGRSVIDWNARCLDEPLRLKLVSGDHLAVTGRHYVWDDESSRLEPIPDLVRYAIHEVGNAVVLRPVGASPSERS